MSNPYDSARAARAALGGALSATLCAVLIAAASGAAPLAAQQTGHEPPRTDARARVVPHDPAVFGPDPVYSDTTYDYQAQLDIYGAKHMNRTQRPLLELGRDMYAEGPLKRGSAAPFGRRNLLMPQLLVYGDLRTGAGLNNFGASDVGVWGNRLNLDVDLRLTATERIHALFRPLEKDGLFTGAVFKTALKGEDNKGFESHLSAEPVALFFEGDLGAMFGGLIGRDAPFDMPIAAGLMPLLFQNGVWLEDAFTGVALTIPARNSPSLDWTNYDITFFAGLDRVSNPLLGGPDSESDRPLFGVTTFIEAYRGYLEAGYAFVGDGADLNQQFHSVSLSFTKRYGRRVSNSVRYIGAIGQEPLDAGPSTANGHLLLIENSLITSRPSTFVPYLNLFVGMGRPSSAARDPGAGGILKNTGLNFEPDALTGFPALTATGHDAVGGALGVNMLGSALNSQIVLEVAGAYPHTVSPGMPGEQFAVGLRAQKPLTNAIIARVDGMFGVRKELENIRGVRFELRYKF